MATKSYIQARNEAQARVAAKMAPALVRITRVVDDAEGMALVHGRTTKATWMIDAWEWETFRWIPTQGSSGATLREAIDAWRRHCCSWIQHPPSPARREPTVAELREALTMALDQWEAWSDGTLTNPSRTVGAWTSERIAELRKLITP